MSQSTTFSTKGLTNDTVTQPPNKFHVFVRQRWCCVVYFSVAVYLITQVEYPQLLADVDLLCFHRRQPQLVGKQLVVQQQIEFPERGGERGRYASFMLTLF